MIYHRAGPGLDLVRTHVTETRKLANVLNEERECKVSVAFLLGGTDVP